MTLLLKFSEVPRLSPLPTLLSLALVALVLLAAGPSGAEETGPPRPVFDERPEKMQGKPLRNFRCSTDAFKEAALPLPSRLGLEELRASGSGQVSSRGLRLVRDRVGTATTVVVVDLRQESHGFVNDEPVSWYTVRDVGNIGRACSLIEAEERALLNGLFNGGTASLFKILDKGEDDIVKAWDTVAVRVERAATEADLAEEHGMGYLRIPVTDHRAPSDGAVDSFVRYVRQLPRDTWLHFHCHAGRGRTTTFMVAYDMMRNAGRVPLDDILKRQWLLGGLDVRKMPPEGAWKRPFAVQRLAFVRRFYSYCREAGPSFRQDWSAWKAAHPE